MIGELTNHLWQSTLFAVMAGLLTVAFRKNRAPGRYWLWFSASLKFFVPFTLLMSFGRQLQSAPTAQEIAPSLPRRLFRIRSSKSRNHFQTSFACCRR